MEEPIADGPTVDSPSQEDADLAVIAPTRQTALAGGVGIGVGAFTTLLAVQTSSVWRMEGLGTLAGRSRDELSAYLATIASVQPTPYLELALLGRHLFHERNLGGPYSYAALGVFESLARELGIQTPALEKRLVKRPDTAALVVAVLAESGDDLRAAAARVYQKQYDAELAALKLLEQHDFAAWRH
jgi:hypothetical protein